MIHLNQARENKEIKTMTREKHYEQYKYLQLKIKFYREQLNDLENTIELLEEAAEHHFNEWLKGADLKND
jgi:hypothetical protein